MKMQQPKDTETPLADVLSSFSCASVGPSTPDVFRHQPLLAGSTGHQVTVLSRIYQCSENGLSPIHQRGINSAMEM